MSNVILILSIVSVFDSTKPNLVTWMFCSEDTIMSRESYIAADAEASVRQLEVDRTHWQHITNAT